MKSLLAHSLNTLLPARCIACNVIVDKAGNLCGKCWQQLDFIGDPVCHCCGLPFPHPAAKDTLCGVCISSVPPYDLARSVLYYNKKSRHLVAGFKYADKLHGTNTYAKWLMTYGKECLHEADILVPVPLHRIRLFTRRYNQAALLANALSELTGIPTQPMLMQRTKHNKPQASLSKKERIANVKRAFAVREAHKKSVQGKTVVLVDDVMTTGATVKECAKVLKNAGAAKVHVLTLARTVER